LAQQKITLKFGHEDPADQRRDKAAHLLADLASRYSDGRIEIKVFPGGQLGNYSTMVQGMQIGTHDMTVTLALAINIAPGLAVFDMPYLFKDRKHFERIVRAPIGEKLLRTPESKGVVGLAYWENGYRHVTNNIRPIKTPEDLKGIKLRTPPSPSRVAMFRQFGANPAPLPFTELYSALQQGVFDGQENPATNIRESKLYEVQKYLSLTSHVYDPQILLISKGRWDALPPWAQAALRKAGEEVGEHMRAEGARLDEQDLAFLSQHMKVNEVDFQAFQRASQPLYDKFPQQDVLKGVLAIIQ
jgi:tripartite ATP-independent transporter DctP family solute receptor